MKMIFTLVTVCVFVFGNGFAVESSQDSTRFSCEYSLIEKLVTLQTENAKLVKRMSALEKRWNDRKKVVSAYIRLSDNTRVTGSMRVMYDLEMSNIGGGFNFELGQFTAPVSGIYLVHVTACLINGGRWIDLNVVEDDKVIGRVFAGDTVGHACGSETLSVHLKSNANIWVERTAGSATWLNEDHGWNTFTVTLLHAD